MRRVRAYVSASRRDVGEKREGLPPSPAKVKVAALQSASLIPGRLKEGRPNYTGGNPGPNPGRGTKSSGAVAALTAATPDHQPGIEPRS